MIISLDRKILDLQPVLNEKYTLKYIQLEPLQTNYLEMGMQDKRVQKNCAKEREIKQTMKTLRYNKGNMEADSEDPIKLGIQLALRRYRVLRKNKVLTFFTNNKIYEFQIRQLKSENRTISNKNDFLINSQYQ